MIWVNKVTDELMEALRKETDSVETYLDENRDELIKIDIRSLWSEMIKKSGLTKTEIIDNSDCGYNYFYCIINGRKTPSRDKIIELVSAMKLSVDDCQKLLKLNGKAPLYPRIKRDSIIIYGIENGQTVFEISEALKKNGEKPLRDGGEAHD